MPMNPLHESGLQPTGLRPRRQRGMSLVELLVGVAVGLIVVAGAAMLAAAQLSGNRNMLLEMQLQQDMRATLEIITHEIRRAGAVAQPTGFVWSETVAGADAGVMDDMAFTTGSNGEVTFRYSRGPGGQLGFRRNGTRLQTRLPATGGWQDLTDNAAMEVTNFTVTPRIAVEPSQTAASTPQRLPCPKLCSGTPAHTNCWPTLRVREVTLELTGRSRADNAITRTLSTVVRVRNDELVLNGATVCPA